MKAKILVLTLICLGMTSCGSQSQKSENDTSADSAEVVMDQSDTDSAVVKEAAVEDTSAADIEMLKQFYKKCVFGTSSPKSFCAQNCLKKLVAANEYDDGGYATWEFRTGAQDGDGPSEVTDVQPDGDGWYTVSYIDMGAKGVTKVLVVDGKIYDYKRVS